MNMTFCDAPESSARLLRHRLWKEIPTARRLIAEYQVRRGIRSRPTENGGTLPSPVALVPPLCSKVLRLRLAAFDQTTRTSHFSENSSRSCTPAQRALLPSAKQSSLYRTRSEERRVGKQYCQ